MQQVGTRSMLPTASVVEPSRLPVPIQRRVRALAISGRHAWVLHKRIMLRVAAAGIACVAIVGAYEAREGIGAGVAMLSDLAQGEFADAGFGIGRIGITGQTLASEQQIVLALGLGPTTSTLNFDVEAARARIEDLPAIDTATVRKVYPDHLAVEVTEKLPVARWRVDGVTFVVDADGEQIGEDHGAYGELPLVIGDGAADDALVMIRALERYQMLEYDLVALSRIADRRWDLLYETGLRVQLPEMGVGPALQQLQTLQEKFAVLDRDVTVIDLRVPGLVALKPAAREEKAEDDE